MKYPKFLFLVKYLQVCNLKVNVIMGKGFKHAYYDIVVQHISNYPMETSLNIDNF